MVRKIPHNANGMVYEITIEETGQGMKVSPTLGGKPLSITYSVDFDVATDFQHYRDTDAIEELVKIAKGDLDAGTVK
jgi:hypothetical protein